jgi:gamma-glutamyltranspeptidase/glutathione hydrolase
MKKNLKGRSKRLASFLYRINLSAILLRMKNMDFTWDFPYPSQRMPVLAKNVVATSQPLAAQAGLQMLKKGGNALDAALATAITLTIVQPTSIGLGGDAFALVWDGKELTGINGSGRSPKKWSLKWFKGKDAIPARGWDAVTVPGAVDAWVRLWERFGKLPFRTLFEPAIKYARDGFPVTPITASAWADAEKNLRDFPDFIQTFLPGGKAPRSGEIFKCPDLANTLEKIAKTKGQSFYHGELAGKIAVHAKDNGGALSRKDLAEHHSEWVNPISLEYRGLRLHEIPPNGQGLAALIALGILQNFDITKYPVDSADSLHLQIEAMKIAFAEVHRHVADPEYMIVSPADLLREDFLAERAGEIKMDRASSPSARIPEDHGTVYLTAADAGGMMVSFIQSNYMGFGSGIVIPGTGITMQNRGCGFVLKKGHPNCVAGGKRPYHTIIPGFVTRNNQPVMSFGVMGGHMQPQGHVQMMIRIFDYKQNPQAACDALRWHVTPDFQLALESGTSPEVVSELERRGHTLLPEFETSLFGGGQFIYRLEDGYLAASDSRKDGLAAGF